jgi:hypothetical protein
MFADLRLRVPDTDAQFPAQVANVEGAELLILFAQIVLIDAFENTEPKFEFSASSSFSNGPCKGYGAACHDKLVYRSRQLAGYLP